MSCLVVGSIYNNITLLETCGAVVTRVLRELRGHGAGVTSMVIDSADADFRVGKD